MVKIDLITGFLGSGKTTFLKKYAAWLMDQGMHIGILENDYGAVNVDMMLLQDIAGDQCDLSMVAGACDPDCHKRRFKTKLISMGMTGYDRVIIEPSGIFDMDEFFDVLQEEPLNRWYEIGNVIAIVDGGLEENLSEQSQFFLASQIADAGKIIFSKVQELPQDLPLKTAGRLNDLLKKLHCPRILSENDLLIKDWSAFTQADWQAIKDCGYLQESYVKLTAAGENDFDTIYYMNEKVSLSGLEDTLKAIFHDPACGNIFRIKGFLSQENQWYEINASREKIRISPIKKGQEVFIVIGENVNKEILDQYFRKL